MSRNQHSTPNTQHPVMRRTTDTPPATPDFEEVIKLLAVFSAASNTLRQIEADANGELLEMIDEFKKDYAAAQEAATKAESALETICRAHPEWFQTARSIKTPYGKVQFHRGTKLDIANAEATCRLLRATLGDEQAKPYIRSVEEPDKEALEVLPDDQLARVMVKRVVDDSFSATAAKVDFGKAYAEAEKAKAV